MTWRVLVSAPYMVPVIERFRPVFEAHDIEPLVAQVEERLSEAELLDLVGDIDGVIAGDDAFTERVLAAAPRLKVISKWGTGIDSIDSEACKRRGISVRNTPNAFSEPVADTVLGYILAFSRRSFETTGAIQRGEWRKPPAVALNECAVGIIGVGNCGRAVARRVVAFGARVIGCDPLPPPEDFLAATGMEMVTKEALLEQADFVSLNCTLNPTSHHIIAEPELARMKPTAYLINTARGPLVDEAALVRALEAAEIAGAGLDVFEVEPLPKNSRLARMDNVLLSPHNANSSPKAWERVHHSTIKNLIEELEKHVPWPAVSSSPA